MSTLGSYTLFHYTRRIEWLKDILSNGFHHYRIAEKIPGRHLGYITNGICFCNIPLSNIEQHTDWYGEYGIGLKRHELKKYGCSPVIYTHTSSPFLVSGSSYKAKNWYRDNPLLTSFIKRNEGKQRKPPFRKRQYKDFTKEMEWRIVSGIVDVYQISNLDELKELDAPKNTADNIILTPNMIEYIILSKKDEVGPFCKWLDDTFPKDYLDYTTKIITLPQILKDF